MLRLLHLVGLTELSDRQYALVKESGVERRFNRAAYSISAPILAISAILAGVLADFELPEMLHDWQGQGHSWVGMMDPVGALLDESRDALKRGDLERARAALTEAERLAPRDPEVQAYGVWFSDVEADILTMPTEPGAVPTSEY